MFIIWLEIPYNWCQKYFSPSSHVIYYVNDQNGFPRHFIFAVLLKTLWKDTWRLFISNFYCIYGFLNVLTIVLLTCTFIYNKIIACILFISSIIHDVGTYGWRGNLHNFVYDVGTFHRLRVFVFYQRCY